MVHAVSIHQDGEGDYPAAEFFYLFIYYFNFWSAYGPPLSKQTKGGVGLILIYFKI